MKTLGIVRAYLGNFRQDPTAIPFSASTRTRRKIFQSDSAICRESIVVSPSLPAQACEGLPPRKASVYVFVSKVLNQCMLTTSGHLLSNTMFFFNTNI